MQRFVRDSRLLPVVACSSPLFPKSRSSLKGHFLFNDACGFASSVPRDEISNVSSARPSSRVSRVSMKTFVKRTESIKRLLMLLDTIRDWDDVQTPLAITGLRVALNQYTASQVIRSCSCPEIALRFFKWLDKKDDFQPDTYIYNALIHCLGKAGKLKEMEGIASHAIEIGKASGVMFSTLISAYRRMRDLDGAVRSWQTMLDSKSQPNAVAYTVMIDTYAIMKKYKDAGECFFQLINSSHAGPTIKTCSVLIYHLAEEGKLDAAQEIFDNLGKVKLRPNRVTYSHLMMGYAKAGDIKMVVKLVENFKEFGNSPYNLGESFRYVLQFLVNEGKIDDATKVMEAGWPNASQKEIQDAITEFQRGQIVVVSPRGQSYQLYSHIQEVGFGTDDDLETEERGDGKEDIRLSHFGGYSVSEEEGDKEGNMALFYSRGQDVRSISNILAFVKCMVEWSSGTALALDKANISWNCHLVSEVLIRLKRVQSAWQFYRWVAKKPGYSHDRYTCTAMIKLLIKDGQFPRVRNILNEAEENKLGLSIHTYTRILKACGIYGQGNFAIEVFERLKASGLVPDERCYRHYIHTLHNCGRHWRVASVCSEMRKAGFSLDTSMYSFLIAGFIKAGKLSIARRLTKQMQAAGFHPDAFMLSNLVKAFHATGRLDKVELLFNGMRECGMVPAIPIYEIMDQVLSQLGKCEEAYKLQRELNTLVGNGKKIRTVQHEMLLHFYSIFVDSFKDDIKSQTLVAAS